MYRPTSAKGDKREVAWVYAPLNSEHAHLSGHSGIDDADDAGRRLLKPDTERLGDEARNRRGRPVEVERYLSAE
jgi:hypothetical protein